MNEDEILQMVGRSLDARFAAEDGEFCECDEPEHPNEDGLMCRRCFRENRTRREAKTRRMREPHEFVLYERAAELRMCAVCSWLGRRPSPRASRVTAPAVEARPLLDYEQPTRASLPRRGRGALRRDTERWL